VLRPRITSIILLLFLACVVFPVLVVKGCNFYNPPEVTELPPGAPFVELRRAATGQVERLPLEEYVKGVVAAEMPAAFGIEALKAQAILARTYIVTRMRAFGGPGDPEHSTADISDDPARGQAWLDEAALKSRWGVLQYSTYWRKIEQAVDGTRGLIAVYNGDPIQAAYHSTCGGNTEAAANVWQADVPYLQSVVCQWDSHSPRLNQQVTLTWAQVESKLGSQAGGLAVAASSGKGGIIKVVSKTAAGRVASVKVGDLTTTGVSLRYSLGLPSAAFTVTETAKGVTFNTRGYGHGVGMCQYGADGMATAGHKYDQIIAHYLPGVTLRPLLGP
jgi:stage II sporulation protein D